jgi:hypothetical protein
MMGRVLPSIMGRNSAKSNMQELGVGMMKDAMSGLSDDLKNVGEPVDIHSADSGGEFNDHPAKM